MKSPRPQAHMLDIIPIWDENDLMETKSPEAKLNARFPLEVFIGLRAFAKEHQCSINSELFWIVRQYLEKERKNECYSMSTKSLVHPSNIQPLMRRSALSSSSGINV